VKHDVNSGLSGLNVCPAGSSSTNKTRRRRLLYQR